MPIAIYLRQVEDPTLNRKPFTNKWPFWLLIIPLLLGLLLIAAMLLAEDEDRLVLANKPCNSATHDDPATAAVETCVTVSAPAPTSHSPAHQEASDERAAALDRLGITESQDDEERRQNDGSNNNDDNNEKCSDYQESADARQPSDLTPPAAN